MEIIIGNQDLAMEILSRLPLKSLAQSKCISKQFLAIISDPYFERRYALLHPPLFSGLFLVPTNTSHFPEIEYVPLSQDHSSPVVPSLSFLTSQGLKVLQSCNGLLLCCSSIDGSLEHMTYHVNNPTTRQLVDLPSCPYMKGEFGLTLAFDPVISPYYKVICVQLLDGDPQGLCQISVYTSETGLWTSIRESFLAPEGIDFRHGVYCGGNIHWMKIRSTLPRGVYFEIKTSCLKLMPAELPIADFHHHEYICDAYFGHSQGCLYYVVATPISGHLNIFEMNHDYSTWLFKFSVNLIDLAHKYPSMAPMSHNSYMDMSYQYDVLFVIRGQNENDVKLLLSIPGGVICIDHKKESWKVSDLKVCGDERRLWYRVYSAFEYYETMSSI